MRTQVVAITPQAQKVLNALVKAAQECRRGRDLVIQQGLRDGNEAARRRFYPNGVFVLPRQSHEPRDAEYWLTTGPDGRLQRRGRGESRAEESYTRGRARARA